MSVPAAEILTLQIHSRGSRSQVAPQKTRDVKKAKTDKEGDDDEDVETDDAEEDGDGSNQYCETCGGWVERAPCVPMQIHTF